MLISDTKKFFRQNRKSVFTNSVKVGLQSTSKAVSVARSILGVPLVSNFNSMGTIPLVFSSVVRTYVRMQSLL